MLQLSPGNEYVSLTGASPVTNIALCFKDSRHFLFQIV